jgi:type II secretory pathway component PulF
MQKFERTFGDFCINIIRVGETSGTLHQNLDYLAEELKKKEILKKKVLGALVYPAVVVTATVGIALVLTIYIFPKISPIFQSFKTTLPLSTRILISVSNFLIHDGGILFVALVVGIVAYIFLLRIRMFHAFMDRVLLRVPLFGKLSQNYNIVNSTRTLALLLRANVRIVEALQIVSASSRNLMYRNAISHVEREVMKGQKLSEELAKFPGLFPSLMIHMIHVGEETGNLSESLLYVSGMFEEEINDLTKNLTTLLEPALMIVMGIIVGFIAISIITPIYGITQNLHQ